MMDFTREKNNRVAYVLAVKQGSINQRVEGILLLKGYFEKLVLVTKSGNIKDEQHIVIKPFLNPFGIFKRIKLDRIGKKLERFFLFPSPNILFVAHAKRQLKKLVGADIKKGKKVYIISCLPPHDIAIIGLYIKKKYPNVRWIVDWQDLWSYDEYYSNRIPLIYKNKFNRLEKKIFNECDINITTNTKAKDILESDYSVSPDKIKSIPHHYCKKDLQAAGTRVGKQQKYNQKSPINIGFLGSLFKPPKMPGHRVVDAISNVIEAGFDVKLHIFGDTSEFAKEAARPSKDGNIILYNRTSHQESLKNISKCDFVLLAMSELPNCKVVMNIKLPYYLILGLPIIAMVPEHSAVSDIVRETGTGYVIPSISDWGFELKNVLQHHLNGRNIPVRNDKAIENYSWENISVRWEEAIFGEISTN